MLDPFLTYMHMAMIGSLGNPGSWDLVCVGRLVVPHPGGKGWTWFSHPYPS
jgi:hypothetical protein